MTQQDVDKFVFQEYNPGFTVDVEEDIEALGLNDDVIRFISPKKSEPSWMRDDFYTPMETRIGKLRAKYINDVEGSAILDQFAGVRPHPFQADDWNGRDTI